MTTQDQSGRKHPALWIPTLYFAEGLPYFAVQAIAGILYKRRGVPNDVITLYTSLLLLPWSLKPLWSPLLEMFKTKKFFVVVTQFAGGVSLALIALCLPLPGYFRYTLALFAVVAFCSSTHDIAADGLYIASLNAKEQAAYSGWLGAFYNAARLFSKWGLVLLAGYLELRMDVPHAWMVIFLAMGGVLILVGAYHTRTLPSGGDERKAASFEEMWATFKDVGATFLKKPNIWLLLLFVLLYRAGEGQLVAVNQLFLLDKREVGGLGLSTTEFGNSYGFWATIAFLFGSVAGGYFTAWLGLKKALVPLIFIMNLPNLAYVYLSAALPTNTALITGALSIEMFGYGFGFVGVTMLMMQEIAPGKYQTAHYAFATSLMNLGLAIPGAVSGKIQLAVGYQNFFIWVLISAIPALILARFIPIRGAAAQTPEPAAAQAS
jgi:PAT family beta-lactamase induction signal transducer AmpG